MSSRMGQAGASRSEASSQKACSNFCLATPGCVAFSYKTNSCWLSKDRSGTSRVATSSSHRAYEFYDLAERC